MLQPNSPNGKLDSNARIDKLVGQFIAIRTRITELENAFAERLAPFKAMRDKLDAKLLAALDEAGAESVRTNMGTVTALTKSSARLADPEAFMNYVIANGCFELMDRRANAPACREHAVETGVLPPGVQLNTVRHAGVQSPR